MGYCGSGVAFATQSGKRMKRCVRKELSRSAIHRCMVRREVAQQVAGVTDKPDLPFWQSPLKTFPFAMFKKGKKPNQPTGHAAGRFKSVLFVGELGQLTIPNGIQHFRGYDVLYVIPVRAPSHSLGSASSFPRKSFITPAKALRHSRESSSSFPRKRESVRPHGSFKLLHHPRQVFTHERYIARLGMNNGLFHHLCLGFHIFYTFFHFSNGRFRHA